MVGTEMKSQTFIPFKIEIEKNALKIYIENTFCRYKHTLNGMVSLIPTPKQITDDRNIFISMLYFMAIKNQ